MEVYKASAAPGFGEGTQYLGTAAVVGGLWTLDFSDAVVTLNVGEYVSVIGIDASNNTSEFGQNFVVTGGNANPVLANNGPLNVNEGTTTILDNTLLQVTDADNTPDQIVYTLTVHSSRGALRLSGDHIDIGETFTQDDIDNNRVVYEHHGSENVFDSFDYTVSDGAGGSIPATTFNVIITPVNDAPVNSVPVSQTTSVDTPVVFNGANGNQISISDEESGLNPVEITFNAGFGDVTLLDTTGLTLQGGVNGSPSVTYRGTIADINAALAVGLQFDPQASYLGPATVQVITSDLEALPLTDNDTINITVSDTAPVATDDPGAYNAAITGLAPVSYWRLGETAGITAVDGGSAGSDGTYTGGVALDQPGAIVGDADRTVHFDGTDDYIEIPHDPAYLIDNGTIQFWFNADNLAGEQDLFSKDSSSFDNGGHVNVRLLSSGAIEVRLQSINESFYATSAPVVTPGQWHHLAFSFGAQGATVYVDGQIVASNPYAGGLGASSGGSGNPEQIVIGAGSTGSDPGMATPLNRFFQGFIDEVAIFNNQLSTDQIGDIFAAGLQNYTLAENTTLNVSASEGVLINDLDAEGDSLTVAEVQGLPGNVGVATTTAQGGSVTLNANGSFDYTPKAGFDGIDTFTYVATDGSNNSNVATVTITVTGVNDDPVATANSNAVTEDTALVAAGNMLTDDDGAGVDSDPENDALTVTDIDGVINPLIDVVGTYGTLNWDADGSYTYTLNNVLPAVQALNFGSFATDVFTYTVDDGNGGFDTATLTVTVNGRDDISFDIGSTPTVSEAGPTLATFTITVGGTISAGNTANVTVTGGGSATDGTDYLDDFLTALGNAAGSTSGVGLAGNVLTFDSSFVGPTFTFSMNAQNDSLVETTETITASLSGAASPNGVASIGTAATSTDITDNDSVVFTIIANNDPIAETGGSTTFTIDFGGVSLGSGQTASVVVTPSGTATDGVDQTAFDAAIAAAL